MKAVMNFEKGRDFCPMKEANDKILKMNIRIAKESRMPIRKLEAHAHNWLGNPTSPPGTRTLTSVVSFATAMSAVFFPSYL